MRCLQVSQNVEQPSYVTQACNKAWSLIGNGVDGLKGTLRLLQFGSLSFCAMTSKSGGMQRLANAATVIATKACDTRNFVENFDIVEDLKATPEEKAASLAKKAFQGNYGEGRVSTLHRIYSYAASRFCEIADFMSPVNWSIQHGLVSVGQNVAKFCSNLGGGFALLFFGTDAINAVFQQHLITQKMESERLKLMEGMGSDSRSLVKRIDTKLETASWEKYRTIVTKYADKFYNPVHRQRVVEFYQNKQKVAFEQKKNWMTVAVDVSAFALIAIGGFLFQASLGWVATVGLFNAITYSARVLHNSTETRLWHEEPKLA